MQERADLSIEPIRYIMAKSLYIKRLAGSVGEMKRELRFTFACVSRARKQRMVLTSLAGLVTILSTIILLNLETPSGLALSEGKKEPAAAPVAGAQLRRNDNNLMDLTGKGLLLPVLGVKAGDLRDSFHASRSGGRTHQAIDIMAAQGTPVVATTDGPVLKLHTSDRGGIMLYQSDEEGRYVYYYGHLSGYAEGVTEGKRIKKGEVVAYVGDTGNAGPGNYHLHFGISKMTSAGKWSGGEPVNPYPLLVH